MSEATLRFTAMEHVKISTRGDISAKLKQQEAYQIYLFDTTELKGLNGDFSLSVFLEIRIYLFLTDTLEKISVIFLN